jgi:MFS family permease
MTIDISDLDQKETVTEAKTETIMTTHIVAEQKSRDFRWESNIRKSYLIHFFMGLHFISGVLLPFFMIWGRLTFVEVMVLQSYFTLMMLVFEIPCGAIADYKSRRFSLILGATVIAGASLIYGSYPNIVIFIIGETLWAFSGALMSGTHQAIIYDTLRKLNREEEISKVMAKARSFQLLAIGISGPIGSIIGVYLSLNLAEAFMFFPFIIASLISVTLKEPNHNLEKKNTEKYLMIIKSGFRELKVNKVLRILTIEMIVTDSMVFFLIWTYQLYLKALNFQLVFFGFISASMTISQILLNNLAPKLEKKFSNKKRFLQIYTLIPGIGYILSSLIFFIPISIPLILIIIGFGFSRSILFIKGINQQIRSENRATVLSTVNMMASLIHTIFYPLIGYIIMYNLSLTYILLGMLIILSALLTRIKSNYL